MNTTLEKPAALLPEAETLVPSATQPALQQDKSRIAAKKCLLFFGAFLFLMMLLQIQNPVCWEQCVAHIKNIKYACEINYFRELLLNPYLYVALALAFVLERAYPAKAQESLLSPSSFSDFLWLAPNLFFYSTLWLMFISLTHAFYNQYLSFLTIHAFDQCPWYVRSFIALMTADFLAWFSHVIRHKVPLFWSFHSVHHAQKNLNFFTEYRSHILDELLKYTLEALPLFMLEQSFIQILTINQLRYWGSALYHANIRSNYGILRYILVTPQSHRIHHSIEARHHDKNFGGTFCIWDQIFGTQYRGYDEYPETGIADPFFPIDNVSSWKGTVKTFLLQFFYPFKLPI